MYAHFKCLNEHYNNISDNIPKDNSTTLKPELDYDFMDKEIRHIAKNIKKIKAAGDDNIPNEYIYSIIDLFSPVYKKSFNYMWHS